MFYNSLVEILQHPWEGDLIITPFYKWEKGDLTLCHGWQVSGLTFTPGLLGFTAYVLDHLTPHLGSLITFASQ